MIITYSLYCGEIPLYVLGYGNKHTQQIQFPFMTISAVRCIISAYTATIVQTVFVGSVDEIH